MTIIIQQQGNVPPLDEPNYGDGGMSFLDMAKRLHQESAGSGSSPASTANQVGDIKRLVDWISTAWMDIQNERTDWFFMTQPVEFVTTANKGSYSAADAGLATFANYKLDSFRQYRVAAGVGSEMELVHMPYAHFRNLHLFGNMRTLRQMPYNFTVDPAKNLLLGPVPDDAYDINGQAFALPTEFSQDSDRPTLPTQYHMMIVWRALMYYGQKEAAPEAYTHGQNEYNRLKRLLLQDQLPTVQVDGALC
jgi:hypothetical protein